jgi:predicted anti-sigma-YlaC factor YlaD
MTNLNCEYVREVYPDVLNGSANADTSSAVRTHLASCADCRAHAALLTQLHAALVDVPAGLHERVLAGVKAVPRARRLGTNHYVLAATLAAALIGGSLFLNRTRTAETPTAVAAQREATGLGVITVEAAMMTGTGSLQDLTVEELEQLLGEIDS